MTLTIPEWVSPLTSADNLNSQPPRPISNVAGENEPIPITLGEDQVLGRVIAQHYDSGTSTWTVSVAWGLGEIQAIDALWLNDATPLAGVTVTHYLGSVAQGVDPTLAAAIAGYADTNVITTPDNQTIGVAYSVIVYTDGQYPTWPQFRADLRGQKVNGGAYSDTAAYCLASLLSNPIWGLGENVDATSLAALAATNDENVITEPRRRIGFTIDDPKDIHAWIEIIRVYASCWVFKRGDTWFFAANRPAASVATLDQDDFLEGSFRPVIARPSSIPTVMRAIYTDTSQNIYREREIPNPIQLPGVDTGAVPRRESSVRLPGVHRPTQAVREAEERLNLQQQDVGFEGTLFDNHLGLEVGDVVTVSHPLGFTNQLFRIVDMPRVARPGRPQIRAVSYSAGDYVDTEATASFNTTDDFIGAGVQSSGGGGGTTTFYQSSAPTAIGIGDLWFDTDDGRSYRWNGSAWQLIQDQDIATAIANAATAQSTADSKIVTFVQASAPTADSVGDLWFDTDDNDNLYRWSGSAWVEHSQDYATWSNIVGIPAGLVQTFFQSSPPTGQSVGDFWIDSDDGKSYRWNGSAWVEVQDQDIVAALAAAAAAQGTANSKINTFAQASVPTALAVGDFWIETDNGNRIHRWSGASWVDLRDAGIVQAISDASNAQATADGKITTFYQTSSPTAQGVGDIWVDTNDNNLLYRWSGSSWVDIRDDTITQAQADASTAIANAATAQAIADGKVITFAQASAPSASAVGDLWIETDNNNRLYRWNGSSWVDLRDGGIAQALSNASNAQATADGKITTFYQTSPPAAEGVGDIWVDTNDNNLMYRWSGSAWVDIRDDTITTAQATATTAIANAATAQAVADNKVVTFVQTSAPSAQSVGDLWLDTNDDNRLYRWSGSAWVSYAQDEADWAKVFGANRPDDNATNNTGALADEDNIGGIDNPMTTNGSIRSGKTSFAGGQNGFWLGLDAGVPKFIFGNAAGTKSISWNGTDLLIKGGIIFGAEISLIATRIDYVSTVSPATGSLTVKGADRQINVNSNVGGSPTGDIHQWLKNSTTNGDYSVRLTKISGTNPTSGPLNTWFALSSNRVWSWTRTTDGTTNFDGTLEIRHTASGEIVASENHGVAVTKFTL